MSKKKCGYSTTDLEALDIARGLYDSKINIKRPPSGAQHEVYSAASRGPPIQSVRNKTKLRPSSAKGRITTQKVGNTTASPLAVKPPWRPFSGHAALTRLSPFHTAKENTIGDRAVLEGGPNDCQKILCVPMVYQDSYISNKVAGKWFQTKNPSGWVFFLNGSGRHLPKGVSALQDWLTQNIPNDWADGYSPKSSFVFLPCVQSGQCQPENLPCVPGVQQPGDWLIYAPAPDVKKYKPPKSRVRQFLEEDKRNCTHSYNVNACIKPNQTGTLHHDVYEGKLRVDIIRHEIEDLERLLQGIGNPKGSSIVVRYQHEINNLKDMVKTTLEGYEFPEEGRCQTPVAVSLQEDLVRYPERHGEIMVYIKERRDQCVMELANIEREIMSAKENT